MAEQASAMDTSDEDREAYIERLSNRIMKIFGQITECLEDEEVARIKQMLSQATDLCKNKSAEERPIQDLNNIYVDYLLIVEFRAGISVNLIKQSIRAFLLIEDDVEGLGKRVIEMFLELILTEYPSLAIDMQLSDELLQTYFRLLTEGYEEALHIRLMVVGMFGVGKSSLVSRLCGQDMENIESTVGIDIFLKTCEIDEDGDWIISKDEERERVFNLRLQWLFKKYKKEQNTQPSSYPIQLNKETIDVPTQMETNAPVQNIPPVQPLHEEDPGNTFDNFSSTMIQSKTTNIDLADDIRKRAESSKGAEKDPVRRPTVSIWDFAGQSVYYSTHHFFLNDRSIYLLTLDLSKDLNEIVKEENVMGLHKNLLLDNEKEYTCQEAFRFWIKSIYIYTKQKQVHSTKSNRTEYSPKILLIGTHKDKITSNQLNGRTKKKYTDDYFETALKPFLDTPVNGLVHRRKFLVNNFSKDEKEFLEIKKEVHEIALGMPFLKEQVPAKFIPLEKDIFYLQRGVERIIKFDKLEERNREIEFKASSNEIKLFLAFQHAFGNIIYFDTETLQNTIILKPQWLIDVFKAFVSHKPNKEFAEIKLWNKFTDQGIFPDDLVDKVLLQEEFKDFKEEIIQYMLHLDVIVRPVVFSDDAGDEINSRSQSKDVGYENPSNVKTQDFYIMPCMLPQIPEGSKLKDLFKKVKDEQHTPTMCMYIKQGFLPPFVFHCILATFLKKNPVCVMQDTNILYNGLGSFSITKDIYITVWSWNDILYFRISFPSNAKDMQKFCRQMRIKIEKLVIKCFNFHGKDTYDRENIGNLLDYKIKCHKCPDQVPFEEKSVRGQTFNYMCGLFSVNDLKFLEPGTKKCPSCLELVDIKEVLEYWFEVKENVTGEQRSSSSVTTLTLDPEENPNTHPSPSDKILSILSSTEECLLRGNPNETLLVEIATEIESLNGLHVELSIPDKTVARICKIWDEVKHPEEFKYHVLYEWMKNGQCWVNLFTAMKKVGLDTTHFFRIIQGIEAEDVKKKVEDKLKQLDITKLQSMDDQLLREVSESIGKEFWLLGIRLGIPQPTLEQFDNDCFCNCKEIVYKYLQEWKKKSECCIELLITALIKSNSNIGAVMKKMKEWCSGDD